MVGLAAAVVPAPERGQGADTAVGAVQEILVVLTIGTYRNGPLGAISIGNLSTLGRPPTSVIPSQWMQFFVMPSERLYACLSGDERKAGLRHSGNAVDKMEPSWVINGTGFPF